MYAEYVTPQVEVIHIPAPHKYSFNIPEVKPMTPKSGALLFGGVAAVGLGMGAVVGTYVFFGLVTLAGLVALIESNKYLRHLVKQSSFLVDLALFVATIYATATLGVTITASLTVAGLGFTLAYAPWLRSRK